MELPNEVPVMTLPSATLFPQALLPLYIFEPRYRQMLADTLKAERMISVAMQKPGRTREAPCRVAGLGLIRVSVNHKDGTSHLILQGLTRVELCRTVQYTPYRVQCIRPLQAAPTDTVMVDALLAKVHELVAHRLETGPLPFPFPFSKESSEAKLKPSATQPPNLTMKEVLHYLENLPDADQVADLVSCALLPDAAQRQTILETIELEARLKRLIHFLISEIKSPRKDNTP
jgi:Lon protease-like protein